LDEATVIRLRDRLAHRGPDGAGILTQGSVRLAHRRLAVVDLSEAGHQPMLAHSTSEPARNPAIVYNGELYNDPELREILASRGREFHTRCDTETLLSALEEWGTHALTRLRGMYAFAFHDPVERQVLMARDPLGIKPLYWTRTVMAGSAMVAFASEPGPLLDLSWVARRPDLSTLSAYLTTIRTTLGERTMFENIRTLLPGQALAFDLNDALLRPRDVTPEQGRRVAYSRSGEASLVARVRAEVCESVKVHLRSDAPVCCLLSGGLDSTITATLARRELGERLRTYAAGAPDATCADDDLAYARRVADVLGTEHSEAYISRELFTARWPEMVGALGVPLSTPNEIAINAVARALRQDGQVVAVSGEGADELFAGYELPMFSTARFLESRPHATSRELAAHILADAAWIPIDSKAAILSEDLLRGVEGDDALVTSYEEQLEAIRDEGDDHPMQRHLRLLTRVNLAGLLARLDTAMMLASVEGRTPLADVQVAELAHALPMHMKFRAGEGVLGTKVALRHAFESEIPRAVVSRPKASFPLPFAGWLDGCAGLLRTSPLARACFSEAAIQTVADNPAALFRCAWPMVNIALWGETTLR
jgi:asparagine synthase (glutamine-hydrolysing)